MSSFLNWAVNEELLGRNPARGLRLPDPINKRDKRLPFEREQLHAIFNAPLYRGCVDGERGYNRVGDQRPRNARFWVPLIALFTGARLGEICQLDVTDIRTVDGVSCIVVSQRSLAGTTDKQLKTSASDRLIPVHPTLIECGFLRFAEGKQKAGETKLFDDIETGATGSRPVVFSKWFTQFLRACGAQQSRTSLRCSLHGNIAMRILSKRQLKEPVLYAPQHVARLEKAGQFPKRVHRLSALGGMRRYRASKSIALCGTGPA